MSGPLERLWSDKIDIYRWEERIVNGVTKTVRAKVNDTYVKCHYSKGSLVDTGSGVPTIVNSYTLFCGLDVDIQEGDEIEVIQRNGRQTTLSVGEGFPYGDHQEFAVKRMDTA